MHEQEVGFSALEIPGAYAKRRLSCSLAIYVTLQALLEIRPTSLKQSTQPLASRPKIQEDKILLPATLTACQVLY